MNKRRIRREGPKQAKPIGTMTAPDAYRASGLLIRKRLLQAETTTWAAEPLLEAEALGLQVRKIIESVAFMALSAAEYRNNTTLADLRTKDADKLLTLLQGRALLKLPEAQDIKPPSEPSFAMELHGAQSRNLDLASLKRAYSRASQLVHERHPERLDQAIVASEAIKLAQDAEALRRWLWTHTMFFRGEMILVRMQFPDQARFITQLTGPSQP